MKKEYIVVGNNSFWYASCQNKKEAEEEIEKIKHNLRVYSCGASDEKRKPQTLYVYKAEEIKVVELN